MKVVASWTKHWSFGGGEFGQTPTAEGNRQPQASSFWFYDVAGRWRRQRRPSIDHTQLTYRYAGRDYRLTDVYGNVVKALLT